jgi:hypothetical protein
MTAQMLKPKVQQLDHIAYTVAFTFHGQNTANFDVLLDFSAEVRIKGRIIIHGEALVDRVSDAVRCVIHHETRDKYAWRNLYDRECIADKYAERLRAAIAAITGREVTIHDAAIASPREET